MIAAAFSSAKVAPVAPARQSVVVRAGKYDEELIKTAVRFTHLIYVNPAAGFCQRGLESLGLGNLPWALQRCWAERGAR